METTMDMTTQEEMAKESITIYKEEVKKDLILYKRNPDYREKYSDKILGRNKNKLLIAMLNILDEDINKFYDDNNEDVNYLFTIMEFLPDIIGNNEILKQTTIKRLGELRIELGDLLHLKETNQNNRYRLLENIRAKIDSTLHTYTNELPCDYDPTKQDFISYLIFQEKNIKYIKNAIEEYDHIVNTRDKKNVPLVNRVLKTYLRYLDKYIKDKNLGPIDDLIYYKKVLKVLITAPKIALNEKDKEDMIKELSNNLKSKDHEVIRQKEKHTYFINSIIMLLLGEEETEDLTNLNYEYEVHDTFKATHELEAKRISILNKNVKADGDKKRIYTFDGEGAFELDDALSIEKKDGIYHLGVHIADPLAYIPTDSILYDEAKKRTRSLYCSNPIEERTECIPMYPFSISGDTMSLNEGQYRRAMSHYFDIDESTGELLKYDLKSEQIVVTKNLTYSKFNNDIEHGDDDERYMETLINLCEVAPILGRVYDEETVYREFHNDNAHSIGSSVVEKCMIYTNYNLAKRFDKEGLPYIYRCHKTDEKLLKRINELKERIQFSSDQKYIDRELDMLRSIYPRAYYTTKNEGHLGLGTNYYSHVTSPLRRMADNIADECIYKFILGQYTKDDIKAYEEYIQQMAENINAKRRTLDNYEVERGRMLVKTIKESEY